MIDSHGSLLAKAVSRGLVAAVAVASLLVLLDAGANYSDVTWRPANLAWEPWKLPQEDSTAGSMPYEFRLSANLPLEGAPVPCGASDAAPTSANGDEPLNNGCGDGATVKAVGDLPSTELLSWPGDWLYHRALRF